MSKQWMALVNEGLRCCKDDVIARYLATGSATVAETGQKMDTDFLETIFELQMRAMEDRTAVQAEAAEMLTKLQNRTWKVFLQSGKKRG